jgi:hypothetical protein
MKEKKNDVRFITYDQIKELRDRQKYWENEYRRERIKKLLDEILCDTYGQSI